MTRRLVAGLVRRSRTTRGLTLAALRLVVLLVLASALAPAHHPAHRSVSPPATPTHARRTATPSGSRPISPGTLAAAKRVAARFLVGYLPFLYGRGSARSVEAVTSVLRRQLSRIRDLVTPVERRRHPRVVSLTAVAQSPAAIVATALVVDGGVTSYALRITLSAGREGWIVSGVVSG